MTIAVIKIILWILVALLSLIVLLCLLNVKITIYNKEKSGYKITVGGIKINPEKLIFMKDKHKKKDKEKAEESQKPSSEKKASSDTKKKKGLSDVLSIIKAVATTAKDTLPKGIRIRLKSLDISVGGSDAAEVALNYGRITAVLHGLFALFDSYKSLLYGFRAKRSKVVINANFLSQKTEAEFELAISFFVWQLLFSGIRIGFAAIMAIIENAEENVP